MTRHCIDLTNSQRETWLDKTSHSDTVHIGRWTPGNAHIVSVLEKNYKKRSNRTVTQTKSIAKLLCSCQAMWQRKTDSLNINNTQTFPYNQIKDCWISRAHCLDFSISNLTEVFSLLITLLKGNKKMSTFIHTNLFPIRLISLPIGQLSLAGKFP